jgi:tetratricopeptide (TPR) repeat protein
MQDPSESYAVGYFKANPDAVLDTRPPEEKLEDLESRLTDLELETSEKFTALIHQKSLNYIVYGEDSVEALRSHIALGQFYNENHRPVSALRHMQKVAQLKQTNPVDRPTEIAIAVETADAHLAMRNENRAESQKHVNQASDALRPFADDQIDDALLRYRRDLAKARIFAARGRYGNAMEQYLIAVESLDEANSGDPTSVTAKLFREIAENAETAKLADQAGEYYRKAWQTFTDLGMEESAASIRAKVPPQFDEEDEDDPV